MLRHPLTKHGGAARPVEEHDTAAHSLVHTLFNAANGASGFWTPLRDLNESIQTVVRAVVRGWIILYNHRRGDGITVLAVALTEEGRRMARKNLH